MAYTGEDITQPVKNATTNAEIVELLLDDMKGEHAAIIQYLQHAYKIGEDAGEVPTEVEGIARDEMRHFRWLGELVVELGGDPTMQRDPIFLDGPSSTDLLALDVDAEQRAIDQYRAHIEAIDHPKVKLYLNRILLDELYHQSKFKGFIEEMGGDPDKEVAAEETGPWNNDPTPPAQDLELNEQGQPVPADMDRADRNDHPLVRALNSRIRAEYETILIYLHQGFVSRNAEQRNHLISDRAVWHMTHMGTLGEAVAGLEGHPDMELDFEQPFLQQAPAKPGEFNRWAMRREEAFARNSAELIEQAGDTDEELRADLERMAAHDKFQAEEYRLDNEAAPGK